MILGTITAGNAEFWLLIVFASIVLGSLILDLGVFHKKPGNVGVRSALLQSAFWVSLAIVFGLLIYFLDGNGKEASLEYFSAYVTEYALSVDNIFVMILILRYFKVQEAHYHKVLFWGILGAIVMRGIFILAGSLLIYKAHWILYIFGGILIYTGSKMLFGNNESNDIDEESNPIMKFARRYLRFSHTQEADHFYVRRKGVLYFMPLFMVVLLIESTDLLFAVDSIPAAFVISQNGFVVYTSNILAVLGLRAMFFLLSSVLDKFYLLQKGLSFVLIFIGVKMLLDYFHIEIPIGYSLIAILFLLGGSILLSVLWPKKEEVHISAE